MPAFDDFTAVGAALTGLKTASDLAKAFLDVKGAVEVQAKVFELQGVILNAQRDMFAAQEVQTALIARVSELEQQVARLEAWDGEKERYQLANVGGGALAYALKAEAAGSEPPHSLCARCYQHRQKSILQCETRNPGRIVHLVCQECKSDLITASVRPVTSIDNSR